MIPAGPWGTDWVVVRASAFQGLHTLKVRMNENATYGSTLSTRGTIGSRGTLSKSRNKKSTKGKTDFFHGVCRKPMILLTAGPAGPAGPGLPGSPRAP